MKKIEEFWNIIHYCDYRFEVGVQNFLRGGGTYSSPTSDPKIQQQRDLETEIFEKVFRNPRNGFSSYMAGNFIYVLAAMMGGDIFFISAGLIKFFFNKSLDGIFVFICPLPIVYLTYYFVFKNDKYLDYFKEFSKKPKEWQKQWNWISFLTVILIILSMILSFILMDYLTPLAGASVPLVSE